MQLVYNIKATNQGTVMRYINYQATITIQRNVGDQVETYNCIIPAESETDALNILHMMCNGGSCYTYQVTKLNCV